MDEGGNATYGLKLAIDAAYVRATREGAVGERRPFTRFIVSLSDIRNGLRGNIDETGCFNIDETGDNDAATQVAMSEETTFDEDQWELREQVANLQAATQVGSNSGSVATVEDVEGEDQGQVIRPDELYDGGTTVPGDWYPNDELTDDEDTIAEVRFWNGKDLDELY